MENLHIEELNTVPEFEGNVLRMSHSLLRAHREKTISMNAVFVGSLVFSFSGKTEGGNQRICTRTYSAMSAELGCSRSSVARSMAQLREKGYLKAVSQSGYIFKGADEGFDRIEFDMLTGEHKLKIKVKDEKGEEKYEIRHVKFTKNTAAVFAYLYTNRNKDGQVSFSSSALADKLGMSRRTVDRALKLIAYAGYISRPAEDKGVNRFKSSTWHVSERLLNRLRKHARRAAKQPTPGSTTTVIHKTQAQVDSEARAERAAYDSFTAARRQRAEAVAELNERNAMADKDFAEASKALKSIEVGIVFAEIRNLSTLPELLQKRAEYSAQRSEALKRLKFAECDFVPRYECPKCSDKGYLDSGGICPDCWKAFKNSIGR